MASETAEIIFFLRISSYNFGVPDPAGGLDDAPPPPPPVDESVV